MRPRSLVLSAAAAAVLTAVPFSAQAACHRTTELIDRSAFDGTPEVTGSTIHIEGATSGELGGYLGITVTAKDGSLPVGSDVCERAVVEAVLTVAPGEVLSARVHGDVCTGFLGDSTTVNAAVGTKDLHYSGTAHRKPKVVGDGLVAAGVQSFGAQATFSVSVRW